MNAPRDLYRLIAGLYETPAHTDRRNLHQVVLDLGREYRGATLPGDVPAGKPGTCFQTCQSRVVLDAIDGVEYCEGMAASVGVGVPIDHAWLVRAGQVIDPVWGPGDHEYFGVLIDTETIRQVILKTERWGPLLYAGHLGDLVGEAVARAAKLEAEYAGQPDHISTEEF